MSQTYTLGIQDELRNFHTEFGPQSLDAFAMKVFLENRKEIVAQHNNHTFQINRIETRNKARELADKNHEGFKYFIEKYFKKSSFNQLHEGELDELYESKNEVIKLDQEIKDKRVNEQIRLEHERIERERLVQQKLERERLEKQRLEKVKLEEERLAKVKLEEERKKQRESVEYQHEMYKIQEQERLKSELLEKQRLENERTQRELAQKRRIEQERIRKENEERQRREQEERRRIELQQRQQQQQAVEQRRIAELQRNWKTDWHEFQRVIAEKNITVLYHFTDRANLQSIRNNGGLYSWEYCEDNNIRITFPGGDDLSRSLDRRYNLENYVRLCFTKNHPMMYVAQKKGRINNPVILEIDPEVIYMKDTLFSDMNATKTGHTKGGTLQDFKRIKFDVVKQRDHFDVAEELQKYYQAEVMIKKHIPLQYIRNINNL